MNYSVVIVAAGKAIRAELGYNKAFFILADGKRVIDKSIELFNRDKDCEKIIVILNEDDIDKIDINGKIITKIGGKYRKDSVLAGLLEVDSEYVLIHDGARPYLDKEDLENLKEEVIKSKAAILARPVMETVKYVEDGYIKETINRDNVYIASTPQAFKTDLIKRAFEEYQDEIFTDDASLLEKMNYQVSIVIEKHDNPKLTFPKDFK